MIEVDFAAAEAHLRRAREAHQGGDEETFLAARYLVVIALGLSPPPNKLQQSAQVNPC